MIQEAVVAAMTNFDSNLSAADMLGNHLRYILKGKQVSLGAIEALKEQEMFINIYAIERNVKDNALFVGSGANKWVRFHFLIRHQLAWDLFDIWICETFKLSVKEYHEEYQDYFHGRNTLSLLANSLQSYLNSKMARTHTDAMKDVGDHIDDFFNQFINIIRDDLANRKILLESRAAAEYAKEDQLGYVAHAKPKVRKLTWWQRLWD